MMSRVRVFIYCAAMLRFFAWSVVGRAGVCSWGSGSGGLSCLPLSLFLWTDSPTGDTDVSNHEPKLLSICDEVEPDIRISIVQDQYHYCPETHSNCLMNDSRIPEILDLVHTYA